MSKFIWLKVKKFNRIIDVYINTDNIVLVIESAVEGKEECIIEMIGGLAYYIDSSLSDVVGMINGE